MRIEEAAAGSETFLEVVDSQVMIAWAAWDVLLERPEPHRQSRPDVVPLWDMNKGAVLELSEAEIDTCDRVWYVMSESRCRDAPLGIPVWVTDNLRMNPNTKEVSTARVQRVGQS